MLKFHNGKMIYEANGDKVVLITNTTAERVRDFEAYLKKMFGEVPGLTNIKYELIYFFGE